MLIRRLLSSTNVAALMISAGSGTVPVFSENYVTSSTSALTFARSGQAMMYDSTGKLTYAPNNLLTYSNTFSNAAWTKTNVTVTGGQTDPLGGSNASTLTATAGNGTCTQTTAAFTSNGQNTLWIKRKTGTGTIELSKPDGTYTTVSVTGSWAQYTANYQGASATGAFNIRIVTNGDEVYVYSAAQSQVTYETSARSVDDVITTSAAYYGPRIADYNPATTARAGWLIEGETRTNQAVYSADLSNAGYSNLAVSSATDGTLSPDGVTQALKVTAGSGVQGRYTTSGLNSQTASANYTQSFLVKSGTTNYVWFSRQTNLGSTAAVFDLSSTSNTSASQTYSSTDTVVSTYQKNLGNGWFLVSLTSNSTSTSSHYTLFGAASAATGNTFQTNGFINFTGAGETAYFSYLNWEVGDFASSRIATTSAAVTRAAETVTGTTTLLGYTAATGTLIIEADAPTVNQLALIGGFQSTVDNNPIHMYKGASSLALPGNDYVAWTYSPSTVIAIAANLNSSPFRTGVRWNTSGGATGFAASANGSAVSSGQVRTPSPTTFVIGARDGGGYALMGHIRMVYNYNTDLGDTEFQAKTTVGAAP